MASPSTATAKRTHPRAWLRIAMIVLGLIVTVPPNLIWRLFNRHSPFAIWFLKWAGWCSGARVTVKGSPLRRDALFISNHLSWLDILTLSGISTTAFVAKADMESWPVLGWLSKQNNTVFVRREDMLDAKNQATSLQQALLAGQPITLFPEGTTAGGRQLLPFRSSLIAAVTPAPSGITLVPVAIDYGDLADEIAWTDAESVGVNALRIMSRPGTIPVTINFLEPLDPALFSDRKAIARECQAKIAAALGLE